LWQGGYACAILDQRGHGKPPEGAKNWHGQIPDYQCFIDDIVSVTDAVRKMAPDNPIALYGHSMGGNIVANSLLRLPPDQASAYFCAILESPWFELYDPVSPFLNFLTRILNKVAPTFRHFREMNHDLLSGDAEKKMGYSKDPYYHGFISMRMLTGIIDGCLYASANAARLPVKTFITYADKEMVVCNKAILDFAAKAGDMVELKEYESYHAIHNDINREPYCRDLVAFLDMNLKRS
jgi:alpha-beta hydrolase superfamily lysophospholipase